MDLKPRLRLTLELDVNAEPVSGVVRVGAGHGDGERFSGWMGLTRTIELAIAAARCDDNAAPAQGT